MAIVFLRVMISSTYFMRINVISISGDGDLRVVMVFLWVAILFLSAAIAFFWDMLHGLQWQLYEWQCKTQCKHAQHKLNSWKKKSVNLKHKVYLYS